MALFTDGPISGMEELLVHDTQLTNIANVEGIDVTGKMALAQEEMALELATLLSGRGRAEQSFWQPGKATIGNVVVTSALKLWHTFRSLEMVYEDAYSSQLNDRYGAKREQFHGRARWAYERLAALGIGMVWFPVPRASDPQAVSTAGSLTDGTYYVAMAWMNSRGEEGAPSAVIPVTTRGSSFAVQASSPPACACGWNVYAGTDPGALSRQNASPIAVAQAWLQEGPVVHAGSGPGCGQSPSYSMPAPRMILRG